jgi:sulfopyruvate decarboxylase TPP-binding subunit
MRLLSIAIATALVGICAGPALAGECPMLQAQMERQVNNRLDSAAYTARANMNQAAALHKSGKHAESVAKYDEAAKVVGVKLEHKK